MGARDELTLSVVMPCLNEAATVAACVEQALEAMAAAGIDGEVVVADNGSTDGSQEQAERAGARVVAVATPGYGAALQGGIEAARGRWVLMGDADRSYDFGHLPRFVEELERGRDLVMGNRFRGGIADGAMPPLHRYLGNPVLSGIGRVFFGGPVRDFHCGLRAFRRDLVRELDLRTTGMEFASEMVVKAILAGKNIAEVPTTLAPDGRDRPPHLRSFRDGWRHLRFLLLYSPRWLFLYPGAIVAGLGALVVAWLLPGPRRLGAVELDIHTMLYAATAIIVGAQAVLFYGLSRAVAHRAGLLPAGTPRPSGIQLETGLLLGAALVIGGLAGAVASVLSWSGAAYGELSPQVTMRVVIPSVTAVVLGGQAVLASFFRGLLELPHR